MARLVWFVGLLFGFIACAQDSPSLAEQQQDINAAQDLFVLEWDPETRPLLELAEMEAASTRLLVGVAGESKRIRAAVLLRRARIRQWRGDEAGFLADSAAAYQDDPENIDVQFVYGARFSADPLLVEESNQVARHLIEQHQNKAQGYALKALLCSHRREWRECISMSTEAIKRSPLYPANFIVRADAYARAGMFDDCLKDIEMARRLPPASDGVMAELDELQGVVLATVNRSAEAIPYLHRAVYSFGDERANIRDALWLCYVDRSMPGSGLNVAQQQVQLFPGYARGHSQLAMSRAHFGHLDAALTASKTAIRLSPKESFHWATLARIHEARSEFGLAIDSLQHAMQISGERDRDGLLRLAFLLSASPVESQRDPKAADRLCTRAFAGVDEVRNSAAWLARACIEGNAGKFPEAIQSVDKVAKSHDAPEELRQYAHQLRKQLENRATFRLETQVTKSSFRLPILGWLIPDQK